MGGGIFWIGVVLFWLTALSDPLLGMEFTSAEMAEGYGYAIGLMVMGAGMRSAGRGEQS
jgi:hypothetical protein